MKIKLAILEKDTNYLNRFVTAFNTKYSDKFEIYSFTNLEIALSTIEDSKIEVLLSSDSFDIPFEKLPARCGFAYIVDASDVEMINDRRTVSKFQKAELIYKQILSIYSENAGNISGLKMTDDNCKLITFTSVSGGNGSSTMAAACAMSFASKGFKTLYLNLEKFGSSDYFFSAEGAFGMSDIIYALKSRKANLSIKLESCVKQATNGVYFYSQSPIALDMLELTNDDIMNLISELRLTGSYDYIIFDMDFSLDKSTLDIFRKMHAIVIVGDGSVISNTKISRAYKALETVEANADSPITNRMSIIYNKFSNKTSIVMEDINLKNVGGAPRYEHASIKQVLEQLVNKVNFENIL